MTTFMIAEGHRLGDRIKSLELEGYTVLPGMLTAARTSELRTELEALRLQCSSYTDRQWFAHNVQWEECPTTWKLMSQPNAMTFLERLFGSEIVCISVSYSRSDPGYPGMPLHTDSHPYGSNILGGAGTPPVAVRMLYYLDDLTAERAPLRVVPFSHLSLHADAMPYGRFRSDPEEQVVTCSAGDAVVINQRLFHGVGVNRTNASRSLVAISYRPAWARPTEPLPAAPPDGLARLPEHTRLLVDRPNRGIDETTIINWQRDMPTGGVGLGARRWRHICDDRRSGSDQ
jgi:hypothetical protein